ncbi:SDR family NAD(P)-dependent oxidoreductase [Tsukamurella ocularis]|uniref:SDR family NAD(P)-dependent oxidoreductase n=1 Tax=Tsukamurella ocularis TaxID=1970234 RepID=UPI002167F5AB|nr:SDR family NAD(P)-dependent oxidoreductase [Tsukamurella ocularis]MCS3779437.1 NAD(P)-dependent dehydrogenase (short-subunit alcohol dehydrogenase family) [Tsukamurella ocularis]MCS3788089.1 NAD(P)-dependent dehydrogenase (short-subunit alcohol dehydrogenase family) [Tsukamurella ocularis]MCS3852405.1 NAD(P)-dependent dehydrogenase (short-subunit alcohol dehydrogenase family) [Tsukamurella ocularis]
MSLVDAALDRSIAFGYSNIGFALRKARWDGRDPRAESLAGCTVVVTGATSGIGAAIAEQVVDLGATVVIVGRNSGRATAVRDGILRRQPNASVIVELGDVSDLDALPELAARLAKHGVDVIVHNAGVMPPEWTAAGNGHELSLATHVLGPVLLTDLLLPQLADSADARVIFMSSGGMYTAELPVDDLDYREGEYKGASAYARSKRVQVAMVPVLARRWQSAQVTVAGMHPGWVATPGIADSLPGFTKLAGSLLRNADQGADTAVWLAATTPKPESGKFWHDRAERPEHYLRRTEFSDSDRRAVWRQVCSFAGITP